MRWVGLKQSLTWLGLQNHMLKKRAFSFFSTDDQAEIQLGGIDPDSIVGDFQLTTTIQPNDYAVPVHSVKFGDVELLQFSNPNLKVPIGCQGDECHAPFLAGILDSGTSCLVLPDSPVPGMLSNKPFTQWKHMIGGNTKKPSKKDTFHINIAGKVYDIPYSDWYITQGSDSDQSCIQRMPGGMPMVLVGDVLFRRYVVMFDLTAFPGPVTIGIGKRNPNYKLATAHEYVKKITAVKKPAQVITETKAIKKGYHYPIAADRVPVVNHESTQYFVNVSIGSPRQKMPVIFDTGSSVFGLALCASVPAYLPAYIHTYQTCIQTQTNRLSIHAYMHIHIQTYLQITSITHTYTRPRTPYKVFSHTIQAYIETHIHITHITNPYTHTHTTQHIFLMHMGRGFTL